jgi:hypothetical protein
LIVDGPDRSARRRQQARLINAIAAKAFFLSRNFIGFTPVMPGLQLVWQMWQFIYKISERRAGYAKRAATLTTTSLFVSGLARVLSAYAPEIELELLRNR